MSIRVALYYYSVTIFFSFMMMIGAMGTAVFVQPHTMSTTINIIFNTW